MDYTAEAFDQMQRLWEVKQFNDHQLHCVLRFEHPLDPEILKQAVLASVQVFPILATRFVPGKRPHWTSLHPNDLDRAFLVAQNEAEFEQFLVSKVDETIGPQVRVCLLNATPFSVALKMNHMVCDAADFKAYLYLLCRLYTNGTPHPSTCLDATPPDRSLRPILHRFTLPTRLKSALLQSQHNNHAGGIQFPLAPGGPTQPFILTRKLASERTASIKHQGQTTGATLNDILLTAFYRCLFKLLALPPGTRLRIPLMVDMRRFLANTEQQSTLTNLTSTVTTQLECRPTETFDNTLVRLKTLMDRRKRSNLGLNGFIKLDRAYRFLGDRIANRLLLSMLNNPPISMTNMGILDSTQMRFGNQRPCDAFLCGSIKYKPYFQLAVSSYHGELTLSVNLRGSNDDRASIESFLDELEAELPTNDRRSTLPFIAPGSASPKQ